MMDMVLRIMDVIAMVFPLNIAQKFSKYIAWIVINTNTNLTQMYIRDVKTVFPQKTDNEIRRIVLKSKQNYLSFFATYRFMAYASLKSVETILDNIDIYGTEYVTEIKASNRPVVVISIHMGDFFKGFLKLSTMAPFDKEIGIIKWMDTSKKEQLAYKKFEQLGASIRLLRLRDKPGIDAVRFLRKGHWLLTLCDISPKLVKTGTVEFFNRNAKFPCGPAELAIAGKAIILPIYAAQSGNTETVTICKPIDTAHLVNDAASLSEKGRQITQQLATLTENWLKQHPDQWHFWGMMETFYE